jgi:DegV family protein with EDD domain
VTTVVVTDSTAGLPEDLLIKREITPISLYIRFPDGRVERELELDAGEFYAQLGDTERVPTTAPPEVEDFIAIYEPLLAQGKSIVSVHLSSGMSETCSNARQAAARLAEQGKGGERIQVVDSATGGGAMALVALTAAEGAAAGEDPPTIVRRVRAARQTMKNWITLETLEFLRRGGRIGGAAAWLGSRLQVKPILTAESEIRAVERVRTTERAFERLVDLAHRLHASGSDCWIVQHAASPEAVERLVIRCEKIFHRPPEFVSPFSPVIGTHLGPGSLVLAGIEPAWVESGASAWESADRASS